MNDTPRATPPTGEQAAVLDDLLERLRVTGYSRASEQQGRNAVEAAKQEVSGMRARIAQLERERDAAQELYAESLRRRDDLRCEGDTLRASLAAARAELDAKNKGTDHAST